ncbi:unnamed protein product [Cunninghamella echinulata]
MYSEKRQNPGAACASKGNQLSICEPVNTDTWINGSTHNFVWNYNYPYFITSTNIDIHLYHKSNFQYILIKTWSKLPRLNGVMSVTVDDSWFSTTAYNKNVTWDFSFYILPSGMDSTSELQSTASQFPKPINFNVIQLPTHNPPPSDNNNNNNNNSNNGSNSSVGSDSSGSTNIILSPFTITIIIIAFCVIASIFYCIINRRKRRKQQFVLEHDPRKNVEFQDNTVYSHHSHLGSSVAIATSEASATKPFSNEPPKIQSCKPFDNQINDVELASVKPFDGELEK